MTNKKKVGIVSGHFAPLHLGHCVYLNAAKHYSDHLFAIVNNDEQVQLKGSIPFMDQNERLQIILNLKAVDNGMISIDKEHSTIEQTLRYVYLKFPSMDYELTFYNSGDRDEATWPKAEKEVCEELNINTTYLKFDKINSSSELLQKVKNDQSTANGEGICCSRRTGSC